ncbi:hypothetical protein ACGFX4_04695 [Kitasatospora sp. NPDC048365]|uniref:hypothetical protein n=1 Tax=Kitasatospora sp. NPDC048365 TaxID=3364050 RepID=UPI00371C8017
MAVVMSMVWAGVSPAQYDTVRDAVDWEQLAPAGAQLHAAWFDAEGLHVTDVWNSQEAFEAFMAERLAAEIEKAGITGEPQVSFAPLHRRFVAPGITGAA